MWGLLFKSVRLPTLPYGHASGAQSPIRRCILLPGWSRIDQENHSRFQNHGNHCSWTFDRSDVRWRLFQFCRPRNYQADLRWINLKTHQREIQRRPFAVPVIGFSVLKGGDLFHGIHAGIIQEIISHVEAHILGTRGAYDQRDWLGVRVYFEDPGQGFGLPGMPG